MPTKVIFTAHKDEAVTPSLFAQRSAKKAAQRRETSRLLATGVISAEEAQDRNAPIRQPVRIVNFWPAIRAHTQASQLIADLEHAGFCFLPGKGSHRKYRHPSGVLVVISGQGGDDAKHYQERQVRQKLEEVENNEKK